MDNNIRWENKKLFIGALPIMMPDNDFIKNVVEYKNNLYIEGTLNKYILYDFHYIDKMVLEKVIDRCTFVEWNSIVNSYKTIQRERETMITINNKRKVNTKELKLPCFVEEDGKLYYIFKDFNRISSIHVATGERFIRLWRNADEYFICTGSKPIEVEINILK